MMDQWTKMMEKMWTPWSQMMTDFSWMNKADNPFQGKLSTWFAAMRSGYEINVSWWQTFIEQSEEMFFKTFKDSPLYSSSVEQQMREMYEVVKKAQTNQQEIIKEQLSKMENLMKEKEDK